MCHDTHGHICTVEKEKGKKQNLISVIIFGVVMSSQRTVGVNLDEFCKFFNFLIFFWLFLFPFFLFFRQLLATGNSILAGRGEGEGVVAG